jgi:anti-sigma regulatory factor (Ser/Thr protein kinase)
MLNSAAWMGKILKHLDLKIKNNLPAVASVINSFSEFTNQCDIPMALAMQVNLVFDELLNNIISYAYPDHDIREIEIHVEYSNERLLISIKDDGLPFNPFEQAEVDTTQSVEEREIGGLGIHLVKNVMDEVTYARSDDTNIVTLVREIES